MTLVLYLGLGRLLIWAIQTNGLTKPIFDVHPKLEELRECDFCMGTWVYFAMAFIFPVNVMEPYYVPVFTEFATGVAAAFAVHLMRVGWNTKFGVLEFTEE